MRTTDCSQSHLAQTLNQSCHCLTLNQVTLRSDLDSFVQALSLPPHCFAHSPVFVSPLTRAELQQTIQAIEHVVALPAYQASVLESAHEHAHVCPPNSSVFLGYDFHIDAQGQPRLIEINTNAGGGLLSAFLYHAQHACSHALLEAAEDYLTQFVAMFEHEWRSTQPDRPLRRIAIVDEAPHTQYLYAEFQLFVALFEKQGIHAVICSPQALRYDGAHLWYEGHVIDLVYNRLTDFNLAYATQQALAQAYVQGHVVLTPTPRAYALYANKRNLARLSDGEFLTSLGVDAQTRARLVEGIAATRCVDAAQAQALWQERKSLFFKPMMGYGSKAAYRGDKLTKRVFAEIVAADYVAQTFIAPSTRQLVVDGVVQAFKVDVRAYVYAQHIQLLCARLYQGQTTNFRTEGGGFAPVITHFTG